ncbi:MAG: thioredoxin family protein [Bacillota bacterium]
MRVLTDDTFEPALREALGLLIVKFYANWCPDCRRVETAYRQFPERFPGVAFAELNTDENPQTASRYEVRGIPSFLVFQDGRLVDRLYSRDAKTVAQVEAFVSRFSEGRRAS